MQVTGILRACRNIDCAEADDRFFFLCSDLQQLIHKDTVDGEFHGRWNIFRLFCSRTA
jgi:hypothetical protein